VRSLRNTKERKEIAEFLRDTKPIQSLENGWRWVDTQRQAYKKGKLSEERINLLNGIGFEWERRVGWDKRFEQLKRYKKDHGDCNVPRKYKANPQLGEWVHEQRKLYKNGKLPKERIESLQGIGFSWERHKIVGWDERFDQLEAYKKKHGHCRVPAKYTANPPLGIWVDTQRQAYKEQGGRKISKDRINRLKSIGFSWTGRVRRSANEDIVVVSDVEEEESSPSDLSEDEDDETKDTLTSTTATIRRRYGRVRSHHGVEIVTKKKNSTYDDVGEDEGDDDFGGGSYNIVDDNAVRAMRKSGNKKRKKRLLNLDCFNPAYQSSNERQGGNQRVGGGIISQVNGTNIPAMADDEQAQSEGPVEEEEFANDGSSFHMEDDDDNPGHLNLADQDMGTDDNSTEEVATERGNSNKKRARAASIYNSPPSTSTNSEAGRHISYAQISKGSTLQSNKPSWGASLQQKMANAKGKGLGLTLLGSPTGSNVNRMRVGMTGSRLRGRKGTQPSVNEEGANIRVMMAEKKADLAEERASEAENNMSMLSSRLMEVEERHKKEMAKLKKSHEEELRQKTLEVEAKQSFLDRMKSVFSRYMKQYEEKLGKAKRNHLSEVSALKVRHEVEMSKLQKDFDAARAKIPKAVSHSSRVKRKSTISLGTDTADHEVVYTHAQVVSSKKPRRSPREEETTQFVRREIRGPTQFVTIPREVYEP